MANYLHTLAARAVGDLPVVRPRQPSLFEPATSADVAPPDVLERDEMTVADLSAWDEPAALLGVAPFAARSAVGTAVAARDSARSASDEAGVIRRATAPPRGIEPLRAAATAASGGDATPTATRDQPIPPPWATPTVRGSDAEPPAAAARPLSARRAGVAAPPATAAPIPEPDHAPRATVGPLVDAAAIDAAAPRTARTRADADAGSPIRRVAASQQEMDERVPLASDGAPAISVTIGRIEVRASRPEPARTPARSPRPQPQMTLDAFLSRQGHGR